MSMKIPAAVTLAMLLAGCASVPQSTPPASPNVAERGFVNADQEAIYRVFMGELALRRGRQQAAVQQYARAAQLSRDPSLAREALTLAYQSGDDQLARQLDQRWLTLAPDDRDALRFQALLSARLGQPLTAARQFEQLMQSAHTKDYISVAMLLQQETDIRHGLPVMQRMVQDDEQSADAHYAYAELALHYQHAALAEQEARRAIALKPHFDSAQMLLARALAAQGNYDDALAIIEPRVHAEGSNVVLRLAYAALLVQADRNDEATAQFQMVLKQHPANAQALYSLGLMELSANKFAAARAHFLRLYKSGQSAATAAFFLGNTAELQHHYPEALDWYRRVEDGDRWLSAQIAITRVLIASELPDAARRFMDAIVTENPESTGQLRAAEAQLFSDHGDIASAREILEQGLAAVPDDVDLLYTRGLIEESTGQVSAALEDFRRIIQHSPANADALNALGYTLTVHTTRYQEALGYIQQALDLVPDDPAIIDSMGWVQYRLGHTDLALKYLRKAYKLQNDAQIAAHLVEVLLVAGQKQEANAIWVAAFRLHPDSPDLKNLQSRVAQ